MTTQTELNEPTGTAIASLSTVTTSVATTTTTSVATTMSTQITLAERLESVKAGLVGALTAGLISSALVLVNGWLSLHFAQVAPPMTNSWMVLISGAIAALSGFLFGMTYRYIIRQDQNPHLKSGAVLAFGLVRGLALVEGALKEPTALLPLVSLGIESLLLFAGARLMLDTALARGWVKPFGTVTARVSGTVDGSIAYSTKSSNSG